MAEIIRERTCAEVDEGVVIFLIGMRINKPWKFWKLFPVMLAMPRMLKELESQPDLGLLHARGHFGLRNLMVLQYWKSAQHLQAFAHSASNTHLPAWQSFNKHIGSNGDVGIWHETYVVPKGHAESVYVNMPRYGLGIAGSIFPAKRARATAAKRLTGIEPRTLMHDEDGEAHASE